jgi:hypothetical protein
MPTVTLDEQEWRQVMAVLSQAPWNVANPLLMKIGQQLQQQEGPPPMGPQMDEALEKSNSKRHRA